MSGVGYIDVAPDLLPMIATLLPAAYRITGSYDCNGSVRIAVSSDLLAPGKYHHLVVTVADADGTRSATVDKALGA